MKWPSYQKIKGWEGKVWLFWGGQWTVLFELSLVDHPHEQKSSFSFVEVENLYRTAAETSI